APPATISPYSTVPWARCRVRTATANERNWRERIEVLRNDRALSPALSHQRAANWIPIHQGKLGFPDEGRTHQSSARPRHAGNCPGQNDIPTLRDRVEKPWRWANGRHR